MWYLWLAYPVLVHAAVLSQARWLEVAALVCLLGLALAAPLRRRRAWAWATLCFGAVMATGFSHSGWGLYFLFLPPVLINSFLFLLFAQSLRAGQVPIISRVARHIRGELPDELAIYTRHLTQFWALLFACMGLVSLALALLADPEWWSIFTNFLSYLIIGSIFIVEFFLRRLWFPNQHHTGLAAYFRGLVSTDIRRL